METLVKRAARFALHNAGGLAALRYARRKRFGILMFHSFRETDTQNLDAICSHVARNFEPVSLSALAQGLRTGSALPERAITVTVDDGYRDYLLHGHPVFRRHRIPVTLYAVSEFAAGKIWLWTDQVEFAFENTSKTSVAGILAGEHVHFPVSSRREKALALDRLWQLLKDVPNHSRLEFMEQLGDMCGIAIPPTPPAHRAAMNWNELRTVAAEEVEIGCHTATHPILSRISDPAELLRETAGAREALEDGLGLPVVHFCYPNGYPQDVSEAAVERVRGARFVSAVTCSPGLNSRSEDPFRLRRLALDGSTQLHYSAELLAGLHNGH